DPVAWKVLGTLESQAKRSVELLRQPGAGVRSRSSTRRLLRRFPAGSAASSAGSAGARQGGGTHVRKGGSHTRIGRAGAREGGPGTGVVISGAGAQQKSPCQGQ